MQIIIKFIGKLNFIQKIFLTTGLSIILFWLLDGFGLKPLEDILFRLINIAFSWNFDSKFGQNNYGYFHPDFLFIFCIIGFFVFQGRNLNENYNDKEL